MNQRNRTAPRATLAGNLKYLLSHYGMTQAELAKKSGVSQKTISNLCNPHGNQPKLDVVEAVAAAFGLNLWHLILPGLPEEIFSSSNSNIETLLSDYLTASDEGKEHINRVAEREAKYSS